MAVAASLTNGWRVPWSTNQPKGKVLLLSAEDDAARVLKPRLIANGANLRPGNVRFAEEAFLLDEYGIGLLRSEMASFEPSLVIIDPITPFIAPGLDMNKATDMTRFVGSIDKLAKEFDCAILLVRHLRKTVDGEAMMQGMGSVAISGRSRGGLVMGKHPADPLIRAVAQTKNNYGVEAPTLTLKLIDKKGTQAVEWLGLDEGLDADRLVQSTAQGSAGRPPAMGDAVRVYLQTLLADGEKKSTEVFEEAERLGFSAITVRRMAKIMKIEMRRKGGTASYWSLATS